MHPLKLLHIRLISFLRNRLLKAVKLGAGIHVGDFNHPTIHGTAQDLLLEPTEQFLLRTKAHLPF